MSNLYNRLQELCEEKGVSGYRMCKDVGIQPSIMTDLKMGRRASMKVETAQKVADYFGVTVGSRQHFRFAHIVPILSCLCGLKSIFLRK